MKYLEYKVEDMFLIGKEIFGTDKYGDKYVLSFSCLENMTEYEMKSFIFEYDPHAEEKMEIIDAMNVACKNEIIKTTKYGYFYAKSIDSWIAKNGKSFFNKKRNCDGTYYHTIDIYGKNYPIFDRYHLSNIYVGDVKDVALLIMKKLYDKELKYKKEHEDDLYKVENAMRIDAGKRAYEIICDTKLKIPMHQVLERNKFFTDVKEYENICAIMDLRWEKPFDFRKNKFGELTSNGNVVSTDKANDIAELMLKYGRKISVLIDEMEDGLTKIMES